MVDDIWWFAMLLRPIFAKIDKRKSKFTPCYMDNPHRKNSMSIWITNMLKKGSIKCLYMFEEHLMLWKHHLFCLLMDIDVFNEMHRKF